MITCQQYIFQLTSGQLAEAGLATRLRAGEHRLRCRHCRAFTRNDRQLDVILRTREDHLTQAVGAEEADGAAGGDDIRR